MDEKERYKRESQAKAGAVPPDLRRHSKSRAKIDTHDKEAQKEQSRAREGFATVDIERVSDEQRKHILHEDLGSDKG